MTSEVEKTMGYLVRRIGELEQERDRALALAAQESTNRVAALLRREVEADHQALKAEQRTPSTAPELADQRPAPAPEPLTALEALRILAEAAGPRLCMHPAGHPNPTATGATKKAEEQFAQAWEPLASTWGAEHLRALGKGIGARELWRHLRSGVSLKYLSDHLEEGLQQVTPTREPVAQRNRPEGA